MSAQEFLVRIRAALDATAVPYMVTGSFASSIHGTPRTTQDVDIVIATKPEQLERLVQCFNETEYYVSRSAAVEALALEGQFNVIDLKTGWKVDFIFRKSRPFSLAEFDRRRAADVVGTKMDVATPEDVLIAKLEWARHSASSRQLEDAAGIMRMQGGKLDTEHIERWVGALGLAEELTKAKRLAGMM